MPKEHIKLIAHEVAHWWSDVARPIGRSKWFNEGLAEYLALRYMNSHVSNRTLFQFLVQARTDMRQCSRALSTATIGEGDSDYYPQVYTRGAVLIWMLLSSMDEPSFMRSLKESGLTTGRYLSDVEAWSLVELAKGEHTSIKLDEWVCRSGLPHVVIEAHNESISQEFTKCSITIHQPHSVYHLPMQLVLTDLRGAASVNCIVHEQMSTYDIELPFVPSVLVVEPHDKSIYTWQSISPVEELPVLAQRISNGPPSKVIVCSLMSLGEVCQHLHSVTPDLYEGKYLGVLRDLTPSHCGWVSRWISRRTDNAM